MRSLAGFCCLFLLLTPASGQTDAKTAFTQKCAICHGPDGKAAIPMAKKMGSPDITSAAIQKQPDSVIRDAIAEGKGKMPPYGGILGKAGVDAMVKYIRSLAAPKK